MHALRNTAVAVVGALLIVAVTLVLGPVAAVIGGSLTAWGAFIAWWSFRPVTRDTAQGGHDKGGNRKRPGGPGSEPS